MKGTPNRLPELMSAAGLNKTQVAAEMGVGDATVHRWMNARTGIPDRHKLALARMFGVTVPWLMGWDEPGGNGGQRQAA